MTDATLHLRSEHKNLELHDVLKEPVGVLLGVSAAASNALAEIGVNTVFDLGSSWFFAKAAAVVAASEDGDAAVPSGLLQPESNEEAVATVADLPLESLRGLSEEAATALKAGLDVATIREFAFWPPRRVAHRLVGDAAGTSLADAEDTDAEKLRPRLGEYPTERVYYKQLVMFGIQQDPSGLTPLTGALTLEPLVTNPLGFGQPALGAIVTYSQSWYAQGVTLGQMLHSLALAPGEATRIAVVDWSRRTRASASESIEEAESLDVATEHARAISEVQNAVATEMQEGGSFSSGWSRSTSKGTTYSGSIGGGIAGTIGKATGVLGFGAGGAKASQEAETQGFVESTSWSTGTRSVMAEMAQTINDRTQQHSTSVRNRRATAVREVSQSEHERISTRVVANYNHMHALTIQYYEVVQVYRVQTQHQNAQRVIFLPFELMNFEGPDGLKSVDRFRGSLIVAALTPRIRDLLIDEVGRVEVRAATPIELPTLVAPLGSLALNAASVAAISMATTTTVPSTSTTADTTGDDRTTTRRARTVMRPGQVVGSISGNAMLVAASFENVNVNRVAVEQRDLPASSSTFEVPAQTGEVQFPGGIALRDVQRVRIGQANPNESTGTMRLTVQGDGATNTVEIAFELSANTNLQTIAFLSADAADRRGELIEHLQANRAYYTRAVLQDLDSASLVMLLTGRSWLGRPLVDQVEPRPLAVAGNYLVLRAPVEPESNSGLGDETWERLLEVRGIGETEEARLVPIPTGGVFAEAVLGRSNSAEKLDITRFWNWQDSPIPLMPSEIAPITAGSRAQSEDLTPGQVGSVLNVLNPTTLPDPSGLSASLGVLANSNLFRDMSGLAATQAALGSMSSGTLSAATEAGRLASENLKTTTNQAIEMGKAAADMWKSIHSAKASKGSKSAGTVSEQGAKINQGRDMDRRGVPGTTRPTGGAIGAPSSTQPTPGGGALSGMSGSRTSDHMPGVEDFSRELAYSDDSALGLSPAAFATTAGTLAAPSGPTTGSVSAAAVNPFGSGNYGPIMITGEPHTQVLDDAIAQVRATLNPSLQPWLDKVAFCIARVAPGDGTTVAGARHEELMLYSASLIKVAILFASFELRERVNAIAPTLTASSATDFLSQIEGLLQPSISASIPAIRGRGQRVSFSTILDPSIDTNGHATVEFTPKYQQQLTDIFTTQKNPPATFCIQQLGLSYINGALANGGFFDPRTGKGIWLGGDYAGGFTGVTVKTDDGLTSGQATTAEAMMRLIAGMVTGRLVSNQASSEMLAILADVDFMGPLTAAFSFDIPKAKVGVGSAGKPLFSEAGVATIGGDSFAYCWQNVNGALPLEPVYRVMEQALNNWPS